MIVLSHIVFLLLLILNNFLFNNNNYMMVFLVCSIIFLNSLLLFKNKERRIILVGYLLRLFIIFIDLYTQIPILNSGADSEAFYSTTIEISRNLPLLSQNVYGGLFTKLNGVIASLIGENRFCLQYINVLLYLCMSLIFLKVLQEYYPNDSKNKTIAILLFSLFPNVLILNSIYLRETWISFNLFLGLVLFIKWFKFKKNKYIFYSMLFIIFAAFFHSGVILSLFSILYILQSSNNKKKNNLFSVFVAFLLFYITYTNGALKHFNNLDFDRMNFSVGKFGHSNYLPNVSITSFRDIIVYFPIKSIYFFSSPVPWEIRTFSQVLVFLFDSLFYIVMLFKIFKINKDWFVGIMIAYTPYVIAIFNVGTAMRHRAKFFPVLLLASMIPLKNTKEVIK